ncbi:DNA/RNA non-specific endonuclease [Actinomadura graeca]|uniref:DNA/RNA non-specific endonuclease n=1 Tax=Actinomadura graeca TaxID=2750812 RepID=A0ABX8R4B8_9ACTN|nr:DNA/RNA non-specific endonuclease [Actinomadura graeca]QXJ25905.1 DNA/RNA non-specific endonuclease [Actinomadura graeca]
MNLRPAPAAVSVFLLAGTTVAALSSHAAAAPSGPAAAARQADDAPCDRTIEKNHTYKANGYSFRTDGQGRPERADAFNLKVVPAGRDTCAKKVGQMGGAGYHGGHLIAASLNGVDMRYNLVPQNGTLNTGFYNHQVEGGTRKCIANGGQIPRYVVNAVYPTGTTGIIPDRFVLSITAKKTAERTIPLTIPNRALTDTEKKDFGKTLDDGFKGAGCKT